MMISRRNAIALASAAPVLAAQASSRMPARQAWGKTKDGKPVERFTLKNAHGLEAAITNYGGIVQSLKVPDARGGFADVLLGFDTLAGYLGEHPYFGAIVGRYGNRIAKGRFTLDGTEYKLAVNNGPNHLHGGIKGFDKVVWTAQPKAGNTIELTYLSKDGEEGYPGNLKSIVKYTLSDMDELIIDYTATTDKPTVLNLTNHMYFNLAGEGTGDILGHRMELFANRFTPVDDTLIPTGELQNVADTPFDFRQPHAIGERINANDEQIKRGGGYDHNFVLNGPAGEQVVRAARVSDPGSGRMMEVFSTEPGVQFYTGNFLDGTIKGKGGKVYQRRYGFCLETQHFPDSPNKPAFPTVVLRPGQTHRTTTVYKFSVVK